jgi:hypothetical protein
VTEIVEVKRGAIGLGMGGHHEPHRGKNDEWLTPPEIVQALGPFDLDPCAPINRPWDTATRHLTIEDDGFTSPWGADEFVWLNPPYGPQTWKWLDKLANHPGGGIALTFARTETAGFFEHVWSGPGSDHRALLFLRGRLYFHYVDGTKASANSGAPSVLIAYGEKAMIRMAQRMMAYPVLSGAWVERWSVQ